MKPIKIYCDKCSKFRKFVNPKSSYIFNITLILSIICSKCGDYNDILFKEKESIGILKILGFIK